MVLFEHSVYTEFSVYNFAVYIDNVFESVSDCGLGCVIERYCMSIFMYADDIILLAHVFALQRLLQSVKLSYSG